MTADPVVGVWCVTATTMAGVVARCDHFYCYGRKSVEIALPDRERGLPRYILFLLARDFGLRHSLHEYRNIEQSSH